ncbi:(2Fe-2S)-binding protein [Mesorhizobium sp. B1-1-8]|uniref:(2Fe-2S)-binding protein n=1 Tax=Mesorhizobium sp. B1-1-8 TaxID=2589976 RepID=UPI0011285068|nr:(2Fe-2S)-binding protein [Mesorhizobium sp. B1-1-8]UCI10648.1 (2Fe-2S)-binding protein [Mesorhizobium sp. B1-1-8]
MNTGRIVRLAERDRPKVRFVLDGEMRSALAGDTVLTAMLASGHALRSSEFGPEPRAGFCLMGACQDCWVWQEEGPRLRACSTPVTEGMRLSRKPPEGWP